MSSRLKAALVSFPAGGGTPTVILFQFNPETLTRSMQPETLGPPAIPAQEFISFTMSLDAIDLDAPPDATTQELGLLPTLTALEELARTSRGQAPPQVLLVWGPHRVLAVKPASLVIRETAFNANLAPLRANVDVVLVVLDALAEDAPEPLRRAWNHNQAARRGFVDKLPRDLPDYITRILK